MLVILGILFALQFLYARQAVSLPLKQAFEQTAGVHDVTVSQSSSGVHIDVRVGAVSNLQQTYDQLRTSAQKVLGSTSFGITVQDDPTPALQQDFYALNDILRQGSVTGQFVQMQQQFAAAASKLVGLDKAEVTVGNSQMYVELVSGSHYLYRLIPLPTVSGASAKSSAGA